MTGKLTVLEVKNAKPGAARREVADGGGLYLVVQPSGVKSWAFRYRPRGEGGEVGATRKLTLGTFPAVSLERARREADRARVAVSEQGDPAAVKSQARAARKATDNNRVESVVAAFLDKHAKLKTRPATWRESKRLLEREIVTPWRGKPLSAIRKADIRKLLDAIVERNKPAAALRTLQAIRPMFRWAVRRDIIPFDPCDGIDPPSVPQARERVLARDELRAIWRATELMGVPFGPVVQFLLVTGQRRTEVAALVDDELDLDAATWTVPAHRAKNGKAHVVPLSPLALGIIEGLSPVASDAGYCFTTTGDTAPSGFSKAKRQLDGLIAASGFKMEPWTFHDLRRTLTTGIAALGVAPHVADALLNHKSGTIRGVARVYNRHSYAAEKASALKLWAAYLEHHVIGQDPDVTNGRTIQRSTKHSTDSGIAQQTA